MYRFIIRNIVGAFAGGVIFITYLHEEIESHFFPIISNIETKFVQRDNNIVKFTLDFEKMRRGGGVQNSWWIEGHWNVGRYFQTPTKCDGEPLISGEQPIGTHAHRELCMHIPMFFRDKPFLIGGAIEYSGPPTSYLGWTIPTPIPPIIVPAY